MSGRPQHILGVGDNDTRRFIPSRIPSFADYDRIPLLPAPPSYSLPDAIRRRMVRIGEKLWEIISPNSYRHAYCPGLRPSNLNQYINSLEEQNRRYDGHIGPFDPTRNAQLCLPGKEWRALIVTPAAGDPRDSPEFESVNNCWKSDGIPAIDTGRIQNDYIDKLIKINQETDRRVEALHQAYLDLYFFDNEQRALWSTGVRPTYPTSEQIDALRQLRRFAAAVDRVTEVQRGIKDKRAFIDYVARLPGSRFWMPDPEAEVDFADDRYIGVWLNGAEERTARWYLKEGIPCFIAREISPTERVQLAAREAMIDFAAGTSSSPIHWNVNEYDVRAISRGDLTITSPLRSFDPGWIWPTVPNDINSNKREKAKEKETADYSPPPPVTVIVDRDRVPWVKPPPVKKAEPSRPGAPPTEKKKWRKFVERHQLEGTFREVGAKTNPDHRTHSRYDRERRWHIFFLQAPKPPPGCVSNVNVYGQPCPPGTYRDLGKVRLRQPAWIYNSLDPQPGDAGREAPTPRSEDLPSLRDPPRPPSDHDSDSDDDHYPDLDFLAQSVGNNEGAKSATIIPAAPGMNSLLAATGATESPVSQVTEPNPASERKSDEEVSLGDEDSAGEPMGPQIPLNFMVEDPMDVRMDTVTDDPLEFASSYLTLYGLPLTLNFVSIQTLIMDIGTRIQVPIRRIFRTTVGQNQSFWLETGSVSQARQLRSYMHHRQENGIELLASFANYEDYLRALRQSTHTWPSSSVLYPTPNVNPQPSQPPPANPTGAPPPVAGSSSRRSMSRDRPTRRYQRSPRASDRYGRAKRSRSRSRYRSSERSAYSRRRYQRSPSPPFRNRAFYRRSVSPRRYRRPSRSSSPKSCSPSTESLPPARAQSSALQRAPGHAFIPSTIARVPLPSGALPIVPNAPAALNLSPDAPLPFGANVAFMWSPSGNTFSPVLLQGNTTVIPYPLPPSGPTPSALLPWPVAAALPSMTRNSAAGFDTDRPLALRISDTMIPPPSSPPPENVQPTLMSRMTSDLASRLRNPVGLTSLSARLTDPHTPLAARLGGDDRMEVDSPAIMDPREFEEAHLAAISDMMASAGPLVLDPVQYDYPGANASHSDLEDGEVDDQMVDIGWKRTKRGKRAGRRIQNIRKRDEDDKRRRGRR